MTRTLGAILLLVATGLLLGSVPAQDVSGGPMVQYTRTLKFRVPFNLDPKQEAPSQLQLYVSTDNGRSWQSIASAPPDQGYFRFSTPTDGTFWFAIQTFDKMNHPNPPNMNGASPNLKVIVDSQPPTISVQPLAARGSEVGVSWTVRDDNFNPNQPDAVRLDYRSLNAGGTWLPLSVPAGSNQFYWTPNVAGPIEVRVQARDKAENIGENFTRVSVDGAGVFTPTPAATNPGYSRGYDSNPAATILNPPAAGDLKLVNSKKIKLAYDLKELGPSGVSSVDLWFTQDGRTWKEYGQPVADKDAKHIIFEVEREGQYGVTLVAKSGVGLGERAPLSGDRPQVWIEVDLTKPVVNVRGPLVGQGIDKGKLKISWNATDKNLGTNSITLKYAEKATDNWSIIADKINHTGEYTWTMPPGVPYQFYIKVEAVDRSGNLGEDVTPQPVKVDLSIPRAIPLVVSPAN